MGRLGFLCGSLHLCAKLVRIARRLKDRFLAETRRPAEKPKIKVPRDLTKLTPWLLAENHLAQFVAEAFGLIRIGTFAKLPGF